MKGEQLSAYLPWLKLPHCSASKPKGSRRAGITMSGSARSENGQKAWAGDNPGTSASDPWRTSEVEAVRCRSLAKAWSGAVLPTFAIGVRPPAISDSIGATLIAQWGRETSVESPEGVGHVELAIRP